MTQAEGPSGIEPVQVHPPREGPLDLFIDELAARLVVAVARHPAEGDGRAHANDHAPPSLMPPLRSTTSACSHGGVSRSNAPGRSCQANAVSAEHGSRLARSRTMGRAGGIVGAFLACEHRVRAAGSGW